MNREQRRRQSRVRHIDITKPHNPNCETATLIAQLVDDRDQGWMVDPRPCERCGYVTTVSHTAADVWACLLCGAHGKLGEPGLYLH